MFVGVRWQTQREIASSAVRALFRSSFFPFVFPTFSRIFSFTRNLTACQCTRNGCWSFKRSFHIRFGFWILDDIVAGLFWSTRRFWDDAGRGEHKRDSEGNRVVSKWSGPMNWVKPIVSSSVTLQRADKFRCIHRQPRNYSNSKFMQSITRWNRTSHMQAITHRASIVNLIWILFEFMDSQCLPTFTQHCDATQAGWSASTLDRRRVTAT